MTRPLVSVMMTAHNAGPFVREAIESVRGQTFKDWELVVVDDASADNTAAVLAELSDPRIRIIRRDKPGRSEALNLAMSEARGELLANLDADDWAPPDRLELQAEHMGRHPEIALVGGAVRYVMDRRLTDVIEKPPTEPGEVADVLTRACCIVHSTVMMRRQLAIELGGYRGRYPLSEDYDLWLRMSERAKLANLPDVLAHYRIHASQLTSVWLTDLAMLTLMARASASARRHGLAEPTWDGPIRREHLLAFGADDVAIGREVLNQVISRSDRLRRVGNTAEAQRLLDTGVEQVVGSLGRRRVAAELSWHRGFCAWRDRRRIATLGHVIKACVLAPSFAGRVARRLMGA